MNDARTLELARRLVWIDSVNPSLVPGAAGEAEIAEFVAEFLGEQGLGADLFEVAPGRPNVTARIDGTGDGPTVLLCCHLDTVSVEGMSEPFSGRVRNGRLYGRGAQDVKGGLASMLAAAAILSKAPPRGDVIVAGVADEEAYSAGTESLLAHGLEADMAIVFEPSELDVVVAHKGFAWMSVSTVGVAAHGSRPEEGVDAIAHMGRVLDSIETLGRALANGAQHDRLGAASLHASLIEGGRELSSYPDRCALKLERRTIPGESQADVTAEMVALLKDLRSDPSFRASLEVEFYRPAFEIAEDHALPVGLRAASTKVRGACELVGMTGWTDSALLAEAGIPAVVFGPGGAGLHGVEEYGDVKQICQGRDILVEFLRGL